MANSENPCALGIVTWHVVPMVTICMRAARNSASATYTQHHGLSSEGTVSQRAAISLLIGNLLLTCILLLTRCANFGNLKGSLVSLSLIPLRDQLYLMAVVMQASFIPLRDQLLALTYLSSAEIIYVYWLFISLLREFVGICTRCALALLLSVPVCGAFRTVVAHSASAGDSRLPVEGEICHTTLTFISFFPVQTSVLSFKWVRIGCLSHWRKERGLATDVGCPRNLGMRVCAWLTGIDQHALHTSTARKLGLLAKP
jgi:hypothetical protein